MEGVHADLVGSVVDGGRASRRAGRTRGPARRPGTPRRPSGSNVQLAALVQSHGRAAPGIRSGQLSPRAIGSFMSGGEHWARVDPSTNCTMECTIDCGWTTTSIRSRSTPYSRWASSSSRPLLTRVAELVVITRPMSHVGCASACCGVTSRICSRVQPRNGPPLAVRISRSTSSARPARRHWARAECSESTATSWPSRAAPITSGPPMTRDSLLARARVLPAASAARVAASPADPVIALSTTSQPRPATSVAASGPARIRGRVVCPWAQPRRWRLGVQGELEVLDRGGLGHRRRPASGCRAPGGPAGRSGCRRPPVRRPGTPRVGPR